MGRSGTFGKGRPGGRKKTRVLVTGGRGLLGREIADRLRPDGEILSLDLPECDVTSLADCRRAVGDFRPGIVIHCAAYTAVDAAESDEERATSVNAAGTRNVARACREHGALLVAYGSDYVFDGTSSRPYTEEDRTNPLSAYGRSKLGGEEALREEGAEHLLIRTQWLFGPHGRNFIFAILDRARKTGALTVVSDQAGCPTYSRDLVEATCRLIDAGARGTFHFSNEGATTFYDYASFVIGHAVTEEVTIVPVAARELPPGAYPAPRPAYSVLSKDKYRRVTGASPRGWEEAVLEFLKRTYDGGVAW